MLRCAMKIKPEMTLDIWTDWLCGSGYSNPVIAKILFLHKMESIKPVWRLLDFAEFCMSFGTCSRQEQIDRILKIFYGYYVKLISVVMKDSRKISVNIVSSGGDLTSIR